MAGDAERFAAAIAAALWYGQSTGWLAGDNAYASPMLPALLKRLEQARVVDGQSYLVGQRLQDGHILVAERLWLGALHVQHANDLAPGVQQRTAGIAGIDGRISLN